MMNPTGYRLLALLAFTLFLGVPIAQAQTGFGGTVAIGEDAVFVGQAENTYQPGLVYIYRSGGSGWAEAAQLNAEDATMGDGFGQALAMDGGTLLVGAAPLQDDVPQGRVYAFQRGRDGAFAQQAQFAADDATEKSGFGAALALRDGLAFVGAPGQDSTGAVYVFQRGADSTWTQQAKLTASNGAAEDAFGAALALSGDRLLVGAPRQGDGAGLVYLFENTGDTWQETRTLSPVVDGEGRFGSALTVRDGLALVSAPRLAGTGAAFVFEEGDSGDWETRGRLLPFDGTSRSFFGAALALSDDEAWVGAPGADEFAGQIYRFQRSADGGWASTSKLSADSLAARDFFASALAVKGDVAVAGATGANFGSGKAVFLERTASGDWQAQATFEGRKDALAAVSGKTVDCEDGTATLFDCSEVDLLSFMPVQDLGGQSGVHLNDIWGWTDPESGKEYALVGRTNGASFVDISDPQNPVYVGDLPMTQGAQSSAWRDIKVYEDHAFIVSDAAGAHGMQVIDLTKLRDYDSTPIPFEEDAHYDQINSAHNIVINEATGFAYAVGASGGGQTCGGGLHMINIQDPEHPQFAGCFADEGTGRKGTGYTHDAQCIVYEGPDAEHEGQEICFGSNETALSIADVTDKENPVSLATAEYPNVAYTHQGWITPDHRTLYVNDELDELSGKVDQTRTLIWDVTDLDDPQLVKEYEFGATSSDHNLYIRDGLMYQSNYASGLRVHDISDPENPREVAFFDTSPVGSNGPGFSGTWSNYPFFESGVIAVSSIGEGLFLLKKKSERSL